MTQPDTIQTPRLFLRKLTPEVYRHILTNCPPAESMQLLGLADEEALAKEKTKLALGLSTYNKRFVNFLLIGKTDGRFLGACGFHTWYTEHARAEIGYALYHDTDKQQGLMSEAMDAVLHYGFAQMQLNRVEAMIGPGNTASIRLVKKFGFVEEGRLRGHYCKKGIIEDSLVFGLLKAEYSPLKSM